MAIRTGAGKRRGPEYSRTVKLVGGGRDRTPPDHNHPARNRGRGRLESSSRIIWTVWILPIQVDACKAVLASII